MEKAVAPHSSTLAWKIPGRRSLVGCSPWGRWVSDMTERLHFHFSLLCIGEGNGNPLQCSCLENPRDRGAWWAAVYGVAQSRTQLKWLSSSSYILVATQINFSYDSSCSNRGCNSNFTASRKSSSLAFKRNRIGLCLFSKHPTVQFKNILKQKNWKIQLFCTHQINRTHFFCDQVPQFLYFSWKLIWSVFPYFSV